jgi:hypothetical protein
MIATARSVMAPLTGTGDGLGKYVYCIVETDQRLELGPLGIGPERNRVYTVHGGGLAAVVSDTPLRPHDPTRENLLAHERVGESAVREHTVLPMSFGTIFQTEADVVEFLRSTGTAFRGVLDCIRGKVELGLKVVWDRERAVEKLQREEDAIRGLVEEITADGRRATYFARLRLARLIESALDARAAQILSSVSDALAPLSVSSRPNKVVGDNMILSTAYLVERRREEEFDDAVRDLGRRHGPDLVFRRTGPWPPYNFVNIKLELERAE